MYGVFELGCVFSETAKAQRKTVLIRKDEI